MLYYGFTKRLHKVSISLASGIIADGGVWYVGVAHAQTNVQGASMDDGLGVRGKMFIALACTIVPRVGTKLQGANIDDDFGVRGKNFMA